MKGRLITVSRCPLCGEHVEEVPVAALIKNPHQHNAEIVITKTGFKQYIHTSCWDSMIREKRPYNGRLYL